jgi:CxxC motif-containing protein (DUF1111 family)
MKFKWSVGAPVLALLISTGCKSPRQQPALGEPLANLTREQRAQFNEGKQVFQRVFKPENGLGPLFNGNSCAECHESPVVGGIGDEIEVHATRFTPPHSCDPLFEEGGPVVQQHATPLLQALGVLKEPVPLHATSEARRSTPPLFGFGLVDAIPEATILANEDAAQMRGGAIRGHANRTIDGRVGRFGRKSAVATLFEFNTGAFPQEMGVTTPFSPTEETISGTPIPPETDPAPDPEISTNDIEKVTAFTRYLAPPPRQIFKDRSDRYLAERGRKLFTELECAACHIPKMRTGPSTVKGLDRKYVALYSDLLVHDMGTNLADICLNLADPPEFRTEMLMGLRFRDKFLHDGSAKTVQEAIERHGGEAQRSRDRYNDLNDKEKKALLKFLNSI